jgi:type I restriction enzyme M protein
MLDNETKRRIDSARDILVGKLPDPKSQVEQITIALIYKFMDDMDKEAIEFGGKPSFFTGEYEKYGWSKIFDPRLGGFDMLGLYGEAIEKLDQNPNIPQLFRDIFKNAYLPYRDPETLKLFLKTINEFTYDHSEKLGDAFEYLLSVLGSQGDAGQFRTPRHIIDFIVNVLQPKKNETILDPACGTAGFLISSYKYIVKNNSVPGGGGRGGALTPNDRKKLMEHFTGYDISPDMVRLSLVNMYLHHFTSPRIYEYDTLTSEDRWGDYFDIIMANPPFMTPKGGIKPHKKFTMQANRSEVLFVDYIAEHINPTTGRAGIIVPEGIIFQSATAYKALRKLLVDKNYLYAVVSLPAGIFNPYSGVKTSVLLMDKTIAKKTDKILFVKIENDGFDLGAQRKAITKNDLTDALELINNYKSTIQSGESFNQDESAVQTNYLLVDKEKIKANADYNLSIDRYRVNGNLRLANYDMVKVGDVCEVKGGKRIPKGMTFSNEKTLFPYLRVSDFTKSSFKMEDVKYIAKDVFNEIKNYTISKENVYITIAGTIGLFGTIPDEFDGANLTENAAKLIFNSQQINKQFLVLIGMTRHVQSQIERLTHSVGVPKLALERIKSVQFPLPPLSIQQEIVNKIEGWQKIIDGAKQIIENYKPQIDIKPDWEMVKLGEVCEITSSKRIFQNEYVHSGIPFYRTKEIVELSKQEEISLELFISEERYNELKSKFDVPQKGDVLVSAVGTIGIMWVVADNRKFYFKDGNLIWIKNLKGIDPTYLKFVLETAFAFRMAELTNGAAYNALTIIKLKQLEIPFPSLSIQQQIVNRIEQEQQLINANKQLIQIFEQKIKDEINKLWQSDTKEYAIEDEKLTLVAEE